MKFALVDVPAAAVRKKARHGSEMINQLLFGEAVTVLKEKENGWVKTRSLHDAYEGWVQHSLLRQVSEKEAGPVSMYVTEGMINTIRFGETVLQVPAGSSLPAFTGNEGSIGNSRYHFDGQYRNRTVQLPGEGLLKEMSLPWLNAPYLWGGRTQFGVDCSGFVQVIFKMMGKDLPRDAWQQAQEGKTVKKLKEAVCGDLAFFDDKEEIVHVGILLGQEQIIHASGRVRIDAIDKKGILHSDSGRHTHRLRAIKRCW